VCLSSPNPAEVEARGRQAQADEGQQGPECYSRVQSTGCRQPRYTRHRGGASFPRRRRGSSRGHLAEYDSRIVRSRDRGHLRALRWRARNRHVAREGWLRHLQVSQLAAHYPDPG
jgi:hypothetical protein